MTGPRLPGVHVVLEALRPEDAEPMFRWINTKELVSLSAPFKAVSRTEHEKWFDDVRVREDVHIFGIHRAADGVLIGSCQLAGVDATHGSAELRIRIAEEDARGRGYGTEATRLLLAFGFGGLALHRVWLHVFASNGRAIRMYERVGFRHEGVMREATRIDGVWANVLVMGILDGEFGGPS